VLLLVRHELTRLHVCAAPADARAVAQQASAAQYQQHGSEHTDERDDDDARPSDDSLRTQSDVST